MASDYEVLLKRSNGINKTVTIQDCMSEQEARETAEAMYGMEVLRVIWKGRSGGSTSSYTAPTSSSSSSFSDVDVDPFAIVIGLGALFAIYFVVQFWWLIIIGFVIAACVYAVVSKDDD